MKRVLVFTGLLFIFCSCSLPRYAPKPPVLETSKTAAITFSGPVHFINTQNTQKDIVVLVENFKLNVNLKTYTESVISSLKSEFDRNDYPYFETASKKIRIAVVDVSLASSMGGNVCNIDLVIQPGDHPVIGIQASAQSINYQKAIDYAVADAAIRILNHSKIIRYLEGR
ncbi:MAG: hypothetical protein AMJ54_15545 [Deltaproteobacteria bacterium SG8_13]|nr:MAG: hypothetical protein AMJ54_15545 [Deltaproteobacteria bacterium SG8_13]